MHINTAVYIHVMHLNVHIESISMFIWKVSLHLILQSIKNFRNPLTNLLTLKKYTLKYTHTHTHTKLFSLSLSFIFQSKSNFGRKT